MSSELFLTLVQPRELRLPPKDLSAAAPRLVQKVEAAEEEEAAEEVVAEEHQPQV